MTTVTNLVEVFNGWWEAACNFDDAKTKCTKKNFGDPWPFTFRVVVSSDIPRRHPQFDVLREVGSSPAIINAVFQQTDLPHINQDGTFFFGFPERGMSNLEEQAFVNALIKHPQLQKLEWIDILTSSPLIVGNFYKECIAIVRFPDDVTDEERYRESQF